MLLNRWLETFSPARQALELEAEHIEGVVTHRAVR
jgi:hypothetical protein